MVRSMVALGCLSLLACSSTDAADRVIVTDVAAPGDAGGEPDASDAAGPPIDAAEAPDPGTAVLDVATPPDVEEAAPDAAEPELPEPPPDAPETGPEATTPPLIGELCFEDIFDPDEPGPNYDQFTPSIATHCYGTNHQDIQGVQQVVFLGDSVTVGTPNLAHPLSTDNSHFYRNLLAEWLATKFSLDKGDALSWGFWKSYDYLAGKGGKLESGAFRNCSKWGARTDDFLEGGNQLAECFPSGATDKKTLIVFTMGGNDISSITKKGADATPEEVAAGYPTVWKSANEAVDHLRTAVTWLKDPAHFPNGSYVIFANPFEFTDGTGDVSACPAAGLAGYKDWAKPEIQKQIVIHMLEQYMAIAVETQTDLVWMLETFCGHGYVATGANADEENRCYRGPGTPLWFDETCIHPNPPGHAQIAEMFEAVVLE